MIIVIRILFGFATFFIISFLTILIAKIICRYDDKPSSARFRGGAWFISTILASVFIKLWCVLKEFV